MYASRIDTCRCALIVSAARDNKENAANTPIMLPPCMAMCERRSRPLQSCPDRTQYGRNMPEYFGTAHADERDGFEPDS